ncbi:MAG: hypothetical protein WA384_05210 [Rhodomicrobium sp.]
MDGIIVNYNPKSATGTIRAKDGQKFSFRKADWRESRSPRRNYRVEFQADGEEATGISFFQKENTAGAKAAQTTASWRPEPFDLGLIAGLYAIGFFSAAILDVFFNVIRLERNDIIALFVILDILVAVAWISGSKFKLMRGVATFCAVAITGLFLVLLTRHAINGTL